MTTNPIVIQGAWRFGWTLDVHTKSSEFVGYDQNGHEIYDTVRSELGELVYQLKYRGRHNASHIAKVMATFMATKPNALSRVDVIIPIGASTARPVQPVTEISKELGILLARPVLENVVLKTRETPKIKDVRDPEERREMLDGAFKADATLVKDKGVLLIDDLYRSGATANAVTISLINAGAARVYFLAATRTRSNI